jgi:myosin-5
VKPNPESQPGSLQPEYVLEQLRAGGVLEAVRIACAGALGAAAACRLLWLSWLGVCSPTHIPCLLPRIMLPQPTSTNCLPAVAGCAGFPTRKPFMPFAQRYALLLPEAPANSKQHLATGGGGGSGSNGLLPLPLTSSGFVDWFALSETQVRAGAQCNTLPLPAASNSA